MVLGGDKGPFTHTACTEEGKKKVEENKEEDPKPRVWRSPKFAPLVPLLAPGERYQLGNSHVARLASGQSIGHFI